MTAPSKRDIRIGTAQVEALFGAVVPSVFAAAFGAILLTSLLHNLGYTSGRTVVVWPGAISACAAAHILLRRAYQRARPVTETWRVWAAGFTAICLTEGIGWGWASIFLTNTNRFDVELLVMAVCLSIAAGAISAFGAYLPAFLAFFLPTSVPFMIAGFGATDPVRHATYVLTIAFITGMGGIGVVANRAFHRLLALRLQTEDLAADLQRQKEIAEQANLAKSAFLAAASHDLRQPVYALGLFVGALRNVEMAAEGYDLLTQIEASTKAMDDLFTSLLDISRLDAGAVDVSPRPVPLGALLERICRDHAEEAQAKGIALICSHTSATVETDPVHMERIVRNLVSNAVRYTPQGRVLVGARRRGTLVLVQVWDTGPGIPLDQQERVFQEYYQLANPERDRTKGLGLGLAIVRRLTALLDCRLTLRSQPGRGSCFEVAMRRAAAPPSIPITEAEPMQSFPVHGLIVVIDDDIAIREAASRLLKGWGYDVIAAGSGEEARQRLEAAASPPDLLICDYRLRDGENGIALIEQLRACYVTEIPAMLVTGDTAPDRLAEAQASGLLLLHKPVSNSKLRASISNLINKIGGTVPVPPNPPSIPGAQSQIRDLAGD